MKTKYQNGGLEEKIASVFSDFFHETLAPYLEEKFSAIDKRFDENDMDHEKIFRAVERNKDEHDKIFQDLEKAEKLLNVHGKKIKHLKSAVSAL
ncbi:MAG: hypothetical protein ABH816_02990 [Candidatus Levyibacteriota bacterium]